MTVISGEVGLRYNVTTNDETTPTGSANIVTQTEARISNLPLAPTDIVAAMSGTVGTVATIIDLSALQNVDALSIVKGTAPIAFSSIKSIFVDNKSLVNVVTITDGAVESFLPAGEQMTIPVDSGKAVYNGASKTITSNTDDKFRIAANIDLTAVEIYFLGA